MTELTYSDAEICQYRGCTLKAIERVPLKYRDFDRVEHLRFCGPHADMMRSRVQRKGDGEL